MGFSLKGFGKKILGNVIGGRGREAARGDVRRGQEQAVGAIRPAYDSAENYLNRASSGARDESRRGFRGAMGRASSGYGQARQRYKSPEMVQTREQVMRRVMGKGGFDDNTKEMMKAGAREEFGTGLRSAEQALQSYYGDAVAPGMAGENLSIAASRLGADRANAVRDIDIQNEMLKRQEMQDAINTMYGEAGALAGLDTNEARILAQLEAEQGNTLATIEAQTGMNLANLTAEEAAILANIYTGGAAQMMQTRDTQGLMPIFVGLAQGAGQAAGSSMAAGSSRDLKKGIRLLSEREDSENLEKVNRLGIARYQYKDAPRDEPHVGLIAEDAPKELQENGGKAVNVYDMVSVLASAVKALSRKVEVLEGRA